MDVGCKDDCDDPPGVLLGWKTDQAALPAMGATEFICERRVQKPTPREVTERLLVFSYDRFPLSD